MKSPSVTTVPALPWHGSVTGQRGQHPIDRLAMNANATNTCRQAHVLMARNNRGTNSIGYLTQATGEVIGGISGMTATNLSQP